MEDLTALYTVLSPVFSFSEVLEKEDTRTGEKSEVEPKITLKGIQATLEAEMSKVNESRFKQMEVEGKEYISEGNVTRLKGLLVGLTTFNQKLPFDSPTKTRVNTLMTRIEAELRKLEFYESFKPDKAKPEEYLNWLEKKIEGHLPMN